MPEQETEPAWSLSALRDRALIGVMVYSFARIGAVLGMNVEDYYQQGKRYWLRLHEKGGKEHAVPVHHKAETENIRRYGLSGCRRFAHNWDSGAFEAGRLDRSEAYRCCSRR